MAPHHMAWSGRLASPPPVGDGLGAAVQTGLKVSLLGLGSGRRAQRALRAQAMQALWLVWSDPTRRMPGAKGR